MSQQTRTVLKTYFNQGDKPTEQQFVDLIDSLLHKTEDGIAIKTLLEALSGLNKLNKSAIRGADFCLNRRGMGDIMDVDYKAGMTNIMVGDFWVYGGDITPVEGAPVVTGDWVIALTAQSGSYDYDYEDTGKWQIVHFGDTTVNQNTVQLTHSRYNPTTESNTITITGVEATIISITINKLTYFGKLDDGQFNGFDFVWAYTNGNTIISINYDALGFGFQSGMVIDVLYRTS